MVQVERFLGEWGTPACLALAKWRWRAVHTAERNVGGKRFLVNALRKRHWVGPGERGRVGSVGWSTGYGPPARANSFDTWERFHGNHVHVTMLGGRFPSERGESMTTPRVRTFASGLVLASPGRVDPLPGSFTWSSTGPLISPETGRRVPIPLPHHGRRVPGRLPGHRDRALRAPPLRPLRGEQRLPDRRQRRVPDARRGARHPLDQRDLRGGLLTRTNSDPDRPLLPTAGPDRPLLPNP